MRTQEIEKRLIAILLAGGVLAPLSCSSGNVSPPGPMAFTPSPAPTTGGAHSTANTGSRSSITSGGTVNPTPALAAGGSVPNSGTSGGATGISTPTPSGGAPVNGSGSGGIAGAPCLDTPPPNGDTCAHAVEYNWCREPWMNGACAASCGVCEGGANGSGGATPTGGVSNDGVQPPPIQGGTPAWASRYWDCCKPACGWSDNVPSKVAMKSCSMQNQSLGATSQQSACQGGGAYMCWDGAPWAASDTLAYGYAAASGNNYQCGRCYQLQFTGTGRHGNSPGVVSLSGKTMIVQIVNNGGVSADQFDLLIPGGGVGEFNACSSQWGTSDLGAQYGGFLAGCNGDRSCVEQKCQSVFAGKPELLAGCSWFMSWFNLADNPNLVYREVACPAAITARSGLGNPG